MTLDFLAQVDRYRHTQPYATFRTPGRPPVKTEVTLCDFLRRCTNVPTNTVKSALTLAYFKGYTVKLGRPRQLADVASIVQDGFCIRSFIETPDGYVQHDLDYNCLTLGYTLYRLAPTGLTATDYATFEDAYSALRRAVGIDLHRATIAPSC